jgi:hypothetical protein
MSVSPIIYNNSSIFYEDLPAIRNGSGGMLPRCLQWKASFGSLMGHGNALHKGTIRLCDDQAMSEALLSTSAAEDLFFRSLGFGPKGVHCFPRLESYNNTIGRYKLYDPADFFDVMDTCHCFQPLNSSNVGLTDKFAINSSDIVTPTRGQLSPTADSKLCNSVRKMDLMRTDMLATSVLVPNRYMKALARSFYTVNDNIHEPMLAIVFPTGSSVRGGERVSNTATGTTDTAATAITFAKLLSEDENRRVNALGRLIQTVESRGVRFPYFLLITADPRYNLIENKLRKFFASSNVKPLSLTSSGFNRYRNSSLTTNLSSATSVTSYTTTTIPFFPYISTAFAGAEYATHVISESVTACALFISYRVAFRRGVKPSAIYTHLDKHGHELRVNGSVDDSTSNNNVAINSSIGAESSPVSTPQAVSSTSTSINASSTDSGGLRVISYSVYGKDAKYIYGAIRNAQLCPAVFPGWTCRFYVDTNTVPREAQLKLQSYGGQVLPFPTLSHGKTIGPMFARFMAATDETVELFIVRDSDSRLNERDKAIVDEWIASGKDFHVVRDHPYHCPTTVLGGFWGARRAGVSFVGQLISDWTLRKRVDKYEDDQFFLLNAVWPRVQHSLYTHDSYCCEKFKGSHPFPIQRKDDGEHCGQIFDEHDRPKQDHIDKLKSIPAPMSCRGNASWTYS